MAVNKVLTGSGITLIDLSEDTVTSAEHIMSGFVGHLADGTQVTGTGESGSAAISVVDTIDAKGGTIRTITAVDISPTTATASDVANGKIFFTADGTQTTGTASSSSSLILQDKTVTPSESSQTITADSGYDGLSSVEVEAISATYVGSNITVDPTPTSSGATVTIPEGYYSSDTTKSVTATTIATPSISIDSSGLITATQTQSAGYVNSGTTTNTQQLTTQSATTIIPSESSQTILTSGKYMTGDITVDAIPSGYIIPSGSIDINENGTFDVSNYENAIVNISSSSVQNVYHGTSSPSTSIGSDGDIYIISNSGGNVEAYPADYTASNMNSSSYATKCIGVSAEDGSATNNMYSSGSSTTGVVEYSFDLTSIPSNATIDNISCQVKAHEENSSRSTFTLQLYAGDTAKGSNTTVNGTSNTIYTLNCGTWTRSELDSLVLHTEYGYYGGLVAGATLTVAYSMEQDSYDVTLTGSSSGWIISGNNIYQKNNGTWESTNSVSLNNTINRA